MVGMRQNIPPLRGTALSRGLSPRSLASSLWNWHVDSVEGEQVGEEFVFVSIGPHKVYTVLAHPVEPWKRANGDPQSAWTLALDRACEWAKGATTENAALAAVTRNLFYSCGYQYDSRYGRASYFTDQGAFGFTGYILKRPLNNRLISPHELPTDGVERPGNVVNCLDQAHAIYLFGSLLGAGVQVKQINPFGYLNRTTLVGGVETNNPLYLNPNFNNDACCASDATNRSKFDQHFFAMCRERVFDCCVGPALGTGELDGYLQSSIDYSRDTSGSQSGTATNVSDFNLVRTFE